MSVGRVVIPEPLPDGFALFYTTLDSTGRADDPELFAILRQRFGIDAPSLETCMQVHGKAVRHVAAGFSRPFPEGRLKPAPTLEPAPTCDALFTDRRGVALGIKMADCLPVSLCDPVHRVIANVHSGWRGTVQNITAETLDALARETAFDPPAAYAYLGPAIRVCCFEVGEEVAAQFDPRWVDRTRGPKPHVDVAALTESLLRERGFKNVIDTGLCTRCGPPRFHSHRRDKTSGRNLAIAAQ